MSLNSIKKSVGSVLNVFNPFKVDKLGAPPKAENPNKTLAREAKNSAIAGDIAVRNARTRSSTLGAGSRFIEQQMPSTIEPIEPTGPVNTRTKGTNPLTAAVDALSGTTTYGKETGRNLSGNTGIKRRNR